MNRVLATVVLVATLCAGAFSICAQAFAEKGVVVPMASHELGHASAMRGMPCEGVQVSVCSFSLFHQVDFFSHVFPVTLFAFGDLIILAIFLYASCFISWKTFSVLRSTRDYIRTRGRLFLFSWRHIMSPFLLCAFQRGILHAKRYA